MLPPASRVCQTRVGAPRSVRLDWRVGGALTQHGRLTIRLLTIRLTSPVRRAISSPPPRDSNLRSCHHNGQIHEEWRVNLFWRCSFKPNLGSSHERILSETGYERRLSRTWRATYEQRFRGGLVFKAHRRVYHSTLGLRVIKKNKKKESDLPEVRPKSNHPPEALQKRGTHKTVKAGFWPCLSGKRH